MTARPVVFVPNPEMWAYIEIGQTVKHKLAPKEDPILGVVIRRELTQRRDGLSRLLVVEWVGHDGEPTKMTEHWPEDLIVV